MMKNYQSVELWSLFPRVLQPWLVPFAAAISTPFDVLLQSMIAAGIGLEALCTYLGLSEHCVLDHVVRLGLATPAAKPLRKPIPTGWATDDIRRLIIWRLTGVHPELIGLHLGRVRSPSAVRAKARRLGLPVPPRKSLFRPKPEQLTFEPAPPIQDSPHPRNFRTTVPTRIEDVDFGYLTWIGELPGRRGCVENAASGISTNPAAVYAVGVVTCAGVERFTAARLLGLTEPSYRTLRTRLGIPQIANKQAFTETFDVGIGLETIKRNNLEIATGIRSSDGRPPLLFWRRSNERHVRRAPPEREQRRRGDPTSNSYVTVVTRDVLDAEARVSRPTAVAPSASTPVTRQSVHPPVRAWLPTAPARTDRRPSMLPAHVLPAAGFATRRGRLEA